MHFHFLRGPSTLKLNKFSKYTSISDGYMVGEFNINRDSIRRERIKARATFVSSLHEKFSANIPLTVHWDGKLMADLTSSSQVDRLAILASGQGVSQLLGVPKLFSTL